MTVRGAAVTIETGHTSSGTYLRFTTTKANVLAPEITLDDDGVLRAARGELDTALTELKNAIPGMAVTDANAREIYHLLHEIGMQQMWMIFSNPKVMYGLQDFWRSAMPLAHTSNLTPPLVECVGELGAMLPIEFLPLFCLNPPDDIRDRAGLIRACRNIVGFSCIVKRSFVNLPVAQGTRLRTDARDRLRVRFFHHDGLPGAGRELRWFEGAADDVEVVGPYPTGIDGGPSLSDQIHDPRLSLTGTPGAAPDAIQHFACHCYATSEKPLANEIELSGGNTSLRITLQELIKELSGHFGRKDRPAEMPLVVMNACGASRISAAGALSFPWFFLKNDNRGFVGSNIEVPDDIAAEFGIAFYTHLIRDRKPLGLAFHQARHHLLNTFGNPLGISYSAYANPDLRVGYESLE